MFCRITLSIVLLAASIIPAAADQPSCLTQTDSISRTQIAFEPCGYEGYSFDVPAGSEIDLSENDCVVKYPDGSFGVSLHAGKARGSDASRALSLCRSLAANMHLDASGARKIKVNGMNGAIVTGTLESRSVTILILPHKGKELTAIVINDPSRSEWTDRFIRNLKR